MVRILLWFILLIMISCDPGKHEYHVFHEKPFNEILDIAIDADLPFCIILSDSLSINSNKYIDLNRKHKTPINNAIYNFVNIDLKDNKWYAKLLSPQIYPVTCVFNTSGVLIDLIPGSSKESFAYVNKVINTKCPFAEFHYNQKYDKDKLELISYINSAIALKLNIDRGQYVVSKIDSMLQVIEHPYILYLKLQNQLQFGKNIEARKTAQELLLFDSAQDLYEYYDEFMIANQLLDSTYNYKTAPLIESISNKIELSECNIDQIYHLDIDIVNKGEKTLKISDILTSCSCLKLISSKKHLINFGELLTLRFEFTPDALGNIFREVYIASNSKNTPIYLVTINAIVYE